MKNMAQRMGAGEAISSGDLLTLGAVKEQGWEEVSTALAFLGEFGGEGTRQQAAESGMDHSKFPTML